MTNTLGAVLDALLSLLIPLKHRARPDQVIDARAVGLGLEDVGETW